MSDDLEWIDKTETVERWYMYQNWEGKHYEATEPHDGRDVPVMYRDESHSAGTVLGAHPELGDVYCAAGEISTTRIAPTGNPGKWMKVDTPQK